MSGTTFFTLGLGDVVPHTPAGRLITVIEGGMGFGFLAIVISYLPVLYGAFSQREVNISLLDARAGSPPSAVELLRRHLQDHRMDALADYLRDWETWSAQLMESHLSYPVLCYFRSQHQNQSWLAALTTILDVCAAIMAAGERDLTWQARLTFAISRHAVVDLAQVMSVPPKPPDTDRLSPSEFAKLEPLLTGSDFERRDIGEIREKLQHLRSMYEPYVNGFSDRLLMQLPGWVSSQAAVDNWRTSAWKARPAVPAGSSSTVVDDHF
jgi:ion channel